MQCQGKGCDATICFQTAQTTCPLGVIGSSASTALTVRIVSEDGWNSVIVVQLSGTWGQCQCHHCHCHHHLHCNHHQQYYFRATFRQCFFWYRVSSSFLWLSKIIISELIVIKIQQNVQILPRLALAESRSHRRLQPFHIFFNSTAACDYLDLMIYQWWCQIWGVSPWVA